MKMMEDDEDDGEDEEGRTIERQKDERVYRL